MTVSSVKTEITKERDNKVHKNMKYMKKLNGEALFTIFFFHCKYQEIPNLFIGQKV